MPNPQVVRQLIREITQLRQDPPEGIRISTNEENILDLTGIIEGPAGTPYEGGYFRVKFSFTEDFPSVPPKCNFTTKLFHPNVSTTGEICVNTLKKDWQPSYGILHILITIKCLLIYPNPESALDEEAGKLLLEDYTAFEKRAKLICEVHAQPKIKPPEFNASSSSRAASVTPTEPTPHAATGLPVRKASPPSANAPAPKVTPISNLAKSVLPSPTITITPFQPSVNDSSISDAVVLPNPASSILQPSTQAGNIGLPSEGSVLPTGKTLGKRSNTSTTGGAEKKKKSLKRL